MKKKLIAAVLGLLFFVAANGFSQVTTLAPPDKETTSIAPPDKGSASLAPPDKDTASLAPPDKDRVLIAQPVAPEQAAPSPPEVGEQDDWKNKRWYIGGYLGGGGYQHETYHEGGYNDVYVGYYYQRNYYDPYYETSNTSLFTIGAQAELSLSPAFSLELDLGFVSAQGEGFLVMPLLIKFGGRPGPVEIFGNIGYTINAGFTIGATLGVHVESGILFSEVLYAWGNDSNVFVWAFGYKVGLVNREK
jgi:hypothetical protein